MGENSITPPLDSPENSGNQGIQPFAESQQPQFIPPMAPPPYGAMAAPFQFVGPHGIPARAQAMNMLPFMTFGPQISVPRCAVNGPPHGQRVSNPTLREFHRTTIRRSPPRRERVWHNSSLGRTQIFYRHPNSSPPRNPGVQRHSTVSPIPPPPPPPFVPRVSNPRFYQSVEIGMPMPQPQPISFPQYYGYPGYPATFYPGVEAAPITYFPQGVGQGGLPYNVTFYPSPDYANVGNPNNGTWHPYIPNPYVQFPEAGSSAPFLNYNTPMWTPAASPEVGTWTEVVQEEEGFQYEDAPVEQLVEEPVKEEEPVEEPEKQQETIDPDIYVENVVSSDIWGTTSGEGVKSQHSDEFVIAPTCQSEQASDSNGGSSRSTPEVPPPPLSLFPSLWTPIVESEGQFWEYFRTFNRWTLSFQSLRCFLKRNSFQMRMSEIPWDILGINPTAEFERDWQELMMLIETFSADEATLTEHGIPRIRRRNRRDFKYRTYTLSAETRRRFESCQEQDVSYGQPEPVLLFDNSSSFETISNIPSSRIFPINTAGLRNETDVLRYGRYSFNEPTNAPEPREPEYSVRSLQELAQAEDISSSAADSVLEENLAEETQPEIAEIVEWIKKPPDSCFDFDTPGT